MKTAISNPSNIEISIEDDVLVTLKKWDGVKWIQQRHVLSDIHNLSSLIEAAFERYSPDGGYQEEIAKGEEDDTGNWLQAY